MRRHSLNIQLTDKEYQKIAEEMNVSQYAIQKLHSIGALRENVLLDLLIRHDYKIIHRRTKYKPSQIITRLSMFYHVTREKVKAAAWSSSVSNHYCEECGKLIRKCEYVRNEGLCDDCVAKTIEIP